MPGAATAKGHLATAEGHLVMAKGHLASAETVWSLGHHWAILVVQTSNAWSTGQSTSKGQADRLDHRSGRSAVVFVATRRKRAAASPQTRSI